MAETTGSGSEASKARPAVFAEDALGMAGKAVFTARA